MDAGTLERYREAVVRGTVAEEIDLTNLKEEETAVYRWLVAHNWRLEQERINHTDVQEAVGRLRLLPY